ncbi:hypothetical protein TELCIR_00550 [Teladorsagia circumcincta]|uniref:Uncharacterized protein n=1 Tax=Teladorsagia circumcincta TaxID=45464 RepID=A0A2G9V4D4_TELCI|nr:hypothetical protein TELCIR_00550 [Teladorsagia circumcincta]
MANASSGASQASPSESPCTRGRGCAKPSNYAMVSDHAMIKEDLQDTRPVLPKVVITQPSSNDLQSSLTASVETIPMNDKKKCCTIL